MCIRDRQRRAASSGLASREQVERLVEVEVPVTVIKEIEVEVLPKGASWANALTQLADQLDRGLVYDRDLADLTAPEGRAMTASYVGPPPRPTEPPGPWKNAAARRTGTRDPGRAVGRRGSATAR